jgi:hypothetical protein
LALALAGVFHLVSLFAHGILLNTNRLPTPEFFDFSVSIVSLHSLLSAVSYRIIPGVEVSSFVSKSSDPSQGDGVHILAYFPAGGPGNHTEFHQALLKIRTGRFDRAKSMVEKLRALGKPIKLSRVMEIAGPGVAPGRPHVARALVEAGHVATEGDAFGLYLRDQGPAFARWVGYPSNCRLAIRWPFIRTSVSVNVER